jgi:hypothetical protein
MVGRAAAWTARCATCCCGRALFPDCLDIVYRCAHMQSSHPAPWPGHCFSDYLAISVPVYPCTHKPRLHTAMSSLNAACSALLRHGVIRHSLQSSTRPIAHNQGPILRVHFKSETYPLSRRAQPPGGPSKCKFWLIEHEQRDGWIAAFDYVSHVITTSGRTTFMRGRAVQDNHGLTSG